MRDPEECFENAAESRSCEYVILLAPPNKKEEEYSRAPKARAEKIWYILRVFYASMPVCEAGFGKKTARTRRSFENNPELRAQEYAISCAPPNTKEEKYS